MTGQDEKKCQRGIYWIKSTNAGQNFQCARLRLTEYQLSSALSHVVSCNMEIFFSFFLFPIFHSPSAREILRKQKELEKYFSYCTLHRAITSTYCLIFFSINAIYNTMIINYTYVLRWVFKNGRLLILIQSKMYSSYLVSLPNLT